MTQGASDKQRAGTVFMLRVVWLAMLIGQLFFAFVVAGLTAGGVKQSLAPQAAAVLWPVSWITLAVMIPMGYVLRSMLYKRHWQGNAISAAGYYEGNLLLLGLCEGVSLLGLVACLLAGTFWPYVWPSVLAMAVQVVNFPTGTPMQADPFTAQTADKA